MITTIIKVALALNSSPIDLCTVISYESAGTFSTSIKGLPYNTKGDRAVGLIQFTKDTAVGLGTTQYKLSKMSFNGQMKYVYKYFKQRKYIGKGSKDLERMYSTIFCGNPNYKRCMNLGDGYNNYKGIIKQLAGHRKKCLKIFK